MTASPFLKDDSSCAFLQVLSQTSTFFAVCEELDEQALRALDEKAWEIGLGRVNALIAVGMISTGYTSELGSPASAFANGIAAMFHGNAIIAALFTLAVLYLRRGDLSARRNRSVSDDIDFHYEIKMNYEMK